MKNLSVRLATAIVSFVLGVTIAALWASCGQPVTQRLDSVVVAIGASLLEKISDNPTAYERGRRQALTDVQNGHLKVESIGESTITHYLYKEVLLREYGVEFIDYGCLGTDELDQRIRGYNEISRAAIEGRFGAGVLEKVFQQVSEDIHTYKYGVEQIVKTTN